MSFDPRQLLRSILYPGLDIHVRDRGSLRRYWRSGPRDVLDAGCGNGYLAWLAYKSGAQVVALSFDTKSVEKAKKLLVEFRGADPDRLSFECANLYDLSEENRTFDEIICFEVLEHIKGDQIVAREFYRILRPGGVLHLCCPYRLHPRHQAEVLDEAEQGGHVRPGYTEAEYRALLEPLGFKIEQVVGLGTAAVYYVDAVMRKIRNRFGDLLALPLLPLGLAVVSSAKHDPRVPFSLYVRAVKPSVSA